MRILVVDQFGEMGGAQRCLLEAVLGFAERGWQIHAAVPEGPLSAALAPLCREVRTLPCGPFASGRKTASDALRFLAQFPRQAKLIADLSARGGMDVIYVNGPRVLLAAALGRSGRPLIYHAHWMVPQASAAALGREALRSSGASAIVTSHLAAAWLKRSVTPDRIFTVYNGVAGFAPLVRNQPERAATEIRQIAMLGRVSPEKGQLEFVRAVRIVSARAPEVRFSIYGAPMFSKTTYWEQVRSEAAGLPLELPGWTEDVGGCLAGVDLLVVPSEAIDNIPRVILEAFAAGVPVLAFPSGAIPELIEHGKTGLLAREHTPEALAEAILSAIARPGDLRQIAERAHQRWQERYTLRRFQSEICDAVEAVSRRHHHRTPLASAGANAPA